ncbi:xylulokinase [Parasphaerochaeta coccoides]|uniref:Xylulokinase n=1 Tax=Parasphaerochaeta coccoides (strain ATCC BAA-1237 / DSM 17374 / SPN1) TaxID=760011 RepID=F4GIA0_PARC1|nr:FGGY-family carbohydrate kinase [Parasphaerochaeta coccoides]AEC01259.1 Xylulokinase [Parasphaerochaeta coccoides DSM 17374]
MSKYILAHDLGTSGNKATLFDDEGKMVASAVYPYSMKVFNGNWAEQNPQDWWNAVCYSSRSVLASIPPGKLAGVSFSGQMMGCLCVDCNGEPLHDALIYCDQRSDVQEKKFIEKMGFQNIFTITGHRPSSSYSLTKLLWIKENLPDVYAKTNKVLQAKDYMNFLLTGNMFTDWNDASGTNAFDIRTFSWSQEILDGMGIKGTLFPDAVPSHTVIGRVSKKASEVTGIPAGTPVVVGSGDGGSASMGAASISFGKPYCYMGSSSWVSIALDRPFKDKMDSAFNWAHPVQGMYQPCATMQTAGSAISWFCQTFFGSTEGKDLDHMGALAETSPTGANGLYFLPYLLGERSPWWDSHAQGTFVGMNLNTSFSDFCRSVFEGIAMNLNASLKFMLGAVPDRSLMFIGGGAQGKALRRILADVSGCTVQIPKYLTEATSMGAALLGGVGTGIYKDYSIIEKMNPIVETIEPDMEKHEFYKKHSENMAGAYQSLKQWYPQNMHIG